METKEASMSPNINSRTGRILKAGFLYMRTPRFLAHDDHGSDFGVTGHDTGT